MPNTLTAQQLETLLNIVVDHCLKWQQRTGREAKTPRDMIDFLVDSKQDSAFWSALERYNQDQDFDLDFARLQSSLPHTAFSQNQTAEQCLEAMGLSEAEARELLSKIDADRLIQSSVQAAFQAQTDPAVAEKLEQLAGDELPLATAQEYTKRVSVRSRSARVAALLIGGGLLFLLGSVGTCAAVTVLYKGVTL